MRDGWKQMYSTISNRAWAHARIFSAAFGVLLCVLLSAAQASTSTEYRFSVSMNGDPIGEHVVTVTREANETKVAIDVALKVTFGPFTLYSYDQQNRALWRDGALHAFRAVSNDDGEAFLLVAERDPSGRLQVSLNGGAFEAREVWFPTTYWNKDTINQTALLGTQDGEVQEIAVTKVGREDLSFRGRAVATDKYELRGDLDIDLWYDDRGEWMRLAFTYKGRDFVYDRQ